MGVAPLVIYIDVSVTRIHLFSNMSSRARRRGIRHLFVCAVDIDLMEGGVKLSDFHTETQHPTIRKFVGSITLPARHVDDCHNFIGERTFLISVNNFLACCATSFGGKKIIE